MCDLSGFKMGFENGVGVERAEFLRIFVAELNRFWRNFIGEWIMISQVSMIVYGF